MKIVNNSEFTSEIQNGVVVVDFFATWCGPCKMLAPVLEGLSTEMGDKVNFIKVDIDQSPELADRYQISSVPTMMVFKDGEKVDMMVGFLPKEKISQVIEAHL